MKYIKLLLPAIIACNSFAANPNVNTPQPGVSFSVSGASSVEGENEEMSSFPDGQELAVEISNTDMFDDFKVESWVIEPTEATNLDGLSEIVESGGDGVTSWKVPNARWFFLDESDLGGLDNNGNYRPPNDAKYSVTLHYSFSIDGETCNGSVDSEFSVYAHIEAGYYIDSVDQIVGFPNFILDPNYSGDNFSFIVDPDRTQGDLKRDVRGSINLDGVLESSQYYELIEAEELYHKVQYETPTSEASDLFSVDDVYNDSFLSGNFIGNTIEQAIAEGFEATKNAKLIEIVDSLLKLDIYEPGSVQCEIEKVAKEEVGAVHYLELQYTYPVCVEE